MKAKVIYDNIGYRLNKKKTQNLCIDASVEQRKAKVSKGKESQHLLKSMKSLKTFESREKIQIV